MTKPSKSLQDNLSYAACIVRKYNLGDKTFFLNKFDGITLPLLKKAWEHAAKKIQSREIIKDASRIKKEEREIAQQKALHIPNQIESLSMHLDAEFEVRNLRLSHENIERRLRNILAHQALDLLVIETNKQQLAQQAETISKRKSYRRISVGIIVFLCFVAAFSAPRIIKGFTPVESLAAKIYKKSSYKYRVGAICSDGWPSKATGRGACSHHGGVVEWLYETAYHKTMEECRLEAQKLSWRD